MVYSAWSGINISQLGHKLGMVDWITTLLDKTAYTY